MSDQWEYYQTTIDNRPAFVLYDHGVRTSINDLPFTSVVSVRVTFHDPKPNGLPNKDEADGLLALEDDLTSYFSSVGGIFVGRQTVAGNRDFVFYADRPETELSEAFQGIGSKHGYRLRFFTEEDKERRIYWQHLFPTEHDWQVLKDIKVLESLRKNGDSLTKAREVDHWLYFPTDAARSDFQSWAMANGYTVVGSTTKEEGDLRYEIHICHDCVPELAEITRHTLRLFDEAKRRGGNYDGWGALVVKE